MANTNGTHTLSILVVNKPGVLVRCAQVFARRGFNIDALVVSPSVNPKYSRMTITLQGAPQALEQIIKQTSKLIDVIHCCEHSDLDAVDFEVALIKTKLTAQSRPILLQYAKKHDVKVVSESEGTMIFRVVGTTQEIDSFENVLKKYGILELVRSGKLVMATGKEET